MDEAGRGAMGKLRGLLRRGGRAPEPGRPTVRVACFGKHPGWEDHMDHLGLDTDHLVGVWRALYENGVRENLDRGAWAEPLAEGQRLAGFDHMFLWRDGETIDVGLMWASRDKRGRRDYPMIACASATWAGLDWVCAACPGVLQELRSACEGTEQSSGVVAAREAASRELEAALAGRPPSPFGAAAGGALERLGGARVFREDPERFVRWVYHLEREYGFRVGGPAVEGSPEQHAAQHLRVPALDGDGVDALRDWVAGIGAMLPRMPVMVCRARGRGWVDVCVGAPGVREVFPLLVGPGVVPLVTEIPYEIDESDRARLRSEGGLASA